MRHANPASVWTRFAVLPMLVLSIWSRDWIRLVRLIPIALSLVWLFINPLFFAPPQSTRKWASRGVLGERIWSERERSQLPPPFDKLTPQERKILAGLVRGASNAEIGRGLGLNEKTVRNYLTAVFEKLGVDSRVQAALRARDAGIEG